MKGGSWEKAEAIELINPQKSLADGFGRFYSEVVAGLARALSGEHRSCPLGTHVHRLRHLLHEFKWKRESA